MPLTPEQLLTRRVICTGTEGEPLWPNSEFTHGDILIYIKPPGWLSGVYTESGNIELGEKHIGEHLANPLPHLFRQLHWSEFRKQADMPEYLSFQDGTMNRVVGWKYIEHRKKWTCLLLLCEDYEYLDVMGATPATEAEYLEYLNTKNGK